MTAALAGALRACAAGLYCEEAAAELLIGHGAFLRRPDFAAFIDAGTSNTDGTTPMASIAAGTPVSLRDTVTSLDHANLGLLVTAVRHAAGHRPR